MVSNLKSLPEKFINFGGLYLVGQAIFYFSSYVFIYLLSTYLLGSQFSRLTLISSFFFILNIPTDAIYLMVLKYLSSVEVSQNPDLQTQILKYTKYLTVKIALITLVVYLLLIPAMVSYFHLDSSQALLFFTPTIITLFSAALFKSTLHGKEHFSQLGLVMSLEGIAKVLWAIVVIFLGLGLSAALVGFSFSLAIASIAAFILSKSIRNNHLPSNIAISPQISTKLSQFFRQSILASFSIALMLSLDIILANHVLTGAALSNFSYLNLYGRIILMAGLGVSSLFFPKISKHSGSNKVSAVFRLGFITNLSLGVSFITIAFFIPNLLSLIFAQNFTALHQSLIAYAIGCASLAVSAYLIKSQVILQKKSFSLVALVYVFSFGLLAHLIQPNLDTFARLFSLMSIANLSLILLLLTLTYGKSQWQQLAQFFQTKTTLEPLASGKLRILIYNWRDTKHVWGGGAEVYIHELAKRWVAEGHQVTVFCSFDRKTKTDETIDGVTVIRRGGFITVYIWAAVYYLFKFRGRFDYLIDCENGIPFFTPIYTRIPKTLLVHHVHQEVFAENLFFPLAKFAQFLEAHLMPIVYRHTPIATISPTSKKAIRRHLFNTNPIHIIPCGIDLADYRPGKKSPHPLVVYVGRLKQYKRLEDFIQVAKRLHQRNPAIKCTIAGEGDQYDSLHQTIIQHGLENVIDLPGKVSHQQKIKLFQQAWVVMNPSSMEGWSITTIEANACGTPVVGSDVPGLRDSISPRQSGSLIPMGNVDAFTREIFRILTNATLRNDLSNQSRLWAEQYSWHISSKLFLDHINQVRSGENNLKPSLLSPFVPSLKYQ